MNFGHNKRAFTIVEVLVAISAAAILVLTVGTILFMTLRSWNINNTYVRLRRDAACAMEHIARDIHSSTNITSAVDNQLIVQTPGYTARFVRNPADNVISYSRDGTVTDPFLARDVAVFHPSLHTDTAGEVDGVNLHLEMADTGLNISITDKTFVYMRN